MILALLHRTFTPPASLRDAETLRWPDDSAVLSFRMAQFITTCHWQHVPSASCVHAKRLDISKKDRWLRHQHWPSTITDYASHRQFPILIMESRAG
jgi:hypothetical protein